MALLLRTRLLSVEPTRIVLTTHGEARVRVRGRAHGWVSCGRTWRWVFGDFDETFRVAQKPGQLHISAVGLGGYARRTLRFVGALDLTPKAPIWLTGRVRWRAYTVPRLAPLRGQDIRRGLKEHERE